MFPIWECNELVVAPAMCACVASVYRDWLPALTVLVVRSSGA